jgi:hypothetical protein
MKGIETRAQVLIEIHTFISQSTLVYIEHPVVLKPITADHVELYW